MRYAVRSSLPAVKKVKKRTLSFEEGRVRLLRVAIGLTPNTLRCSTLSTCGKEGEKVKGSSSLEGAG
jgi:hypothetical protein